MNLTLLILLLDNRTTAVATGVLVTPAALRIPGQGKRQFQAIVYGRNGNQSFMPQAGVWTISAGSITSAGIATMPAATGADQSVTITFTATQNGAVGTAVATVPASSSETYYGPSAFAINPNSYEDVVPDVAIANPQAMVGVIVSSAGRVLMASADGLDRAFVISSPGALIPGQFSILRDTGSTATAVRAAYR